MFSISLVIRVVDFKLQIASSWIRWAQLVGGAQVNRPPFLVTHLKKCLAKNIRNSFGEKNRSFFQHPGCQVGKFWFRRFEREKTKISIFNVEKAPIQKVGSIDSESLSHLGSVFYISHMSRRISGNQRYLSIQKVWRYESHPSHPSIHHSTLSASLDQAPARSVVPLFSSFLQCFSFHAIANLPLTRVIMVCVCVSDMKKPAGWTKNPAFHWKWQNVSCQRRFRSAEHGNPKPSAMCSN